MAQDLSQSGRRTPTGLHELQTSSVQRDIYLTSEAVGTVRELLRANALECQQRGDNFWAVDHSSGARKYEVDFGSLLRPSKNFAEVSALRREEGRSAHVLDLFGSGVMFSQDQNVDSLTGVRLVNVKVPQAEQLKGRSWDVVEGSLFDESTWNALARSLDERGISAPDLILIRPLGAFRGIPFRLKSDQTQLIQFNSLYQSIVGKAYSLLAADFGALYFQLPKLDKSEVCGRVEVWEEATRRAGFDVRADSSRGTMRIVKSPTSPKDLVMPPPQDFVTLAR